MTDHPERSMRNADATSPNLTSVAKTGNVSNTVCQKLRLVLVVSLVLDGGTLAGRLQPDDVCCSGTGAPGLFNNTGSLQFSSAISNASCAAATLNVNGNRCLADDVSLFVLSEQAVTSKRLHACVSVACSRGV